MSGNLNKAGRVFATIIKVVFYSILAVIGLSILFFVVYAATTKPVEYVNYSQDPWILNRIVSEDSFINEDTITNLEYESRYSMMTNSLGIPSLFPEQLDPGYYGVITIDDSCASQMLEEYEWVRADEVSFTFKELDASIIENRTWYKSYEFETDNFKYLHTIYFDGENSIIFYYQTI